jgi:hypothetical protein
MGANYSSNQTGIPKPGTLVKIVHNKYSRDEDIPDDILKAGATVKVINTQNMLKSRPNFPDLSVTKVQFQNGSYETYLTNNLKFD